MEGYTYKKKLEAGHTGANDLFKGTEVKGNFCKGIDVKDSKTNPIAYLLLQTSVYVSV